MYLEIEALHSVVQFLDLLRFSEASASRAELTGMKYVWFTTLPVEFIFLKQ